MKEFKIISLKFLNHPFLNDLVSDEALEFIAPDEIKNGPYSSVLIGPNGAGKSQILRIVSDIIEDLKNRIGSKLTLVGSIKFNYEMIFYSNGKTYILTYKKHYVKHVLKPKTKVELVINEFSLELNEPISSQQVELNLDLLPTNIVVLSYLVNDKFRFEKREDNSYYTYLGLRDTASSARTRSFSNRIIKYVIDNIVRSRDTTFLKEVIRLIDYDEDYLEVTYKLRYREFFYVKNLTETQFKELFNNWKSFSKRIAEPFSVKYYNKVLKDRPDEIKKIVSLINSIQSNESFELSNDDEVIINILDTKTWDNYIEYFDTLLRLDLVEQSSLRFRKKSKSPSQSSVDLANFSSGEFHLFTSYIALKATVQPGSLILIDEPEISLHPNWQMKYIHFLKEFFKADEFIGCHFIIATHSHFIISDLKNETSEIILVTKNASNNLLTKRIKSDTYGMSAEGVLYYIFQIRSTRNYYFEVEIRDMLSLISGTKADSTVTKKEDLEKVKEHINNLSKYVLNTNDPLNKILKIANEFIANNS